MKKKIIISCFVVLAAILTGIWVRTMEMSADSVFRTFSVFIDTRESGEQTRLTLLQAEEELYISFDDAETLFSADVSVNIQNDVKISFEEGEAFLASEEGDGARKQGDVVYAPFQAMAETLGYCFLQEEEYIGLVSDEFVNEFSFHGLRCGNSEQKLIQALGNTAFSKDQLQDKTVRYMCYTGTEEFFMADVYQGVIRGMYSNSGSWEHKTLSYGTARSRAEDLLNEKYEIDLSVIDQNEVGLGGVILMFDKLGGNVLTAVCVGELASIGHAASASDISLFESEMLEIVNAERAKRGREPVLPSLDVAACAKAHSVDMGNQNFFHHLDPDGNDIKDRMSEKNIPFSVAAENIAAGYDNIILAHHQLLNSMEHRENILGDFVYGGIGIAEKEGSSYRYYYTQNFYSPPEEVQSNEK